MSRVAYVNGHYVPMRDAQVNIEDRGYQFGDGVYEVLHVHRGRFVDTDLHMSRLERSLAAISIAMPLSMPALMHVLREIVRRNRISNGLAYMQVSRGVARRDHAFPKIAPPPALVITARHGAKLPASITHWGASAITAPDQRWGRCDIKSVNLLPNVLAKQAARQAGAYEAILIDNDGLVTEGSSTSVWIVDAKGMLRTRKLGTNLLPGCTRGALIGLLNDAAIGFSETPFSLDELRGASEIFLTSATSFVKPILQLDAKPVGDGKPGPVASRLFAMFARHLDGGQNS